MASQKDTQPYTVHPTADVSPLAAIGDGTRIWHQAQVREEAQIGRSCTIGKDVYIGRGVRLGDNCKIQNGALIYAGATLEEGVFVGPGACIANDRFPRAITPDGAPTDEGDWQIGTVLVKRGASLGAGSIVIPNAVIGEWAMLAAGAVVTADVPAHGLVMGVPGKLQGFVCQCGHRLRVVDDHDSLWAMLCSKCNLTLSIAKAGINTR
ncbi:MAG: acyltransferase [Dehalococcoidia bacterium]